MLTNFKSLLSILFLLSFCTTSEAQFLKRLGQKIERKLERKVEQKVDEEIDEAIDGEKKSTSTSTSTSDSKSTTTTKSSGIVNIRHSATYGTVTIEELSTPLVERNDDGYRITVNWRSHEVDVFDGLALTIKTDQNLRHDEAGTQNRFTFKVPEEAQLTLGYDPEFPHAKQGKDDFKRGISDEYQNYDLLKGEVAIDVLDAENIQVSFSGDMKLRKVIRESKGSEDYSESFYTASITGALDAVGLKFIDNVSGKSTSSEETGVVTSWDDMAPASGSANPPGIYQFTFQTDVQVIIPDEDQPYKFSYLLNPEADYIAILANLSDYDAEMGGESIIVMDGDDSHIFVETSGMKMLMSQNMMQGQAAQNPQEQMANYDYTKFKKTGRTKTVLGAKCYEYEMKDDEVQMNMWVAPDVNLPNWFVRDPEIIDGHIMESVVVTKDGKMTSTITAIHDNISRTINPKEYKKMF